MSEFLDNLNYDEFTSAEFERWAKWHGYSLKIMDSGWAKGKYASTEIRQLWKTWQASRESYSTVAMMGAEIKRLELENAALKGEYSFRRQLITCQHGVAGSTDGVNPEPYIGPCGRGAVAVWRFTKNGEPLYLCEDHDEIMSEHQESVEDAISDEVIL